MFVAATVFAISATATLFVQATPLPNPDNGGVVRSVLATVANIALLQQPSWGATCWGGYVPTCVAYYPDGNALREYVLRSAGGTWEVGSTLNNAGTAIMPGSPIVAVNTRDMSKQTNGARQAQPAEHAVYFVSSDNKLRYFTNQAGWALSPTLLDIGALNTRARFMTVATRSNGHGPYYSIFWSDDSGSVHVWRKDAWGGGTDDGIIKGLTVHGPFTVSISGKQSDPSATGRTLITADGQHWFTTEEVNNDHWAASFPVPTLAGISGVTLPWNTAQQKFYGIGNSGKLTQASLNTAARMFSPNDKIINVFPRRDTPVTTVSTAYTAGGRNYINVFSVVSGKNTRHKIQSVVSSDDGNTWPVSVIAMKF